MADADKTEKPTPKRLKKARQEGQIAKSAEFAVWLQVLVATFVLEFTVVQTGRSAMTMMDELGSVAENPEPGAALAMFGTGFAMTVRAVLPLALVMVFVGVASTFAQVGPVLATKAIQPKLSKLNPINGFKRMFKPQGLWQGAKSALKLLLLTAIAWNPVMSISQTLVETGRPPIGVVASSVASTGLSMVRAVAFVGLVLAVIDYAVQRQQTMKSLKMSKNEIKDEGKQSEGDPMVKGQIRRKMAEMSRNRMISSVAEASVVVVNPTHVAVALKYEPGSPAPVVVAKGKGAFAGRIRAEAEKHYVPIVRDVVLARTLEKTVKVDQMIPADLFEAVALLLAYVITIGKKASILGGTLSNPHAKPIPADWELEPV